MADAQSTTDPKAEQAKSQEPEPQTFEFTVNGRPDGKLRKKGDRVQMLPAQAKYLLQMGHVKPVRAPVKTASKPAGDGANSKPANSKSKPKTETPAA